MPFLASQLGHKKLFEVHRIDKTTTGPIKNIIFEVHRIDRTTTGPIKNIIFLIYESIYKFGLSVWVSVCLFVCLYPINVKTAEPIGPKFFVGHHVPAGKVYE